MRGKSPLGGVAVRLDAPEFCGDGAAEGTDQESDVVFLARPRELEATEGLQGGFHCALSILKNHRLAQSI
jgi:hypothetical protein